MPALTSSPALVLAVIGAVLVPLAVVGLVVLRPRRSAESSSRRRTLLARASAALVLTLLAQGLAVVAVGLAVNDQYDFYASWGDLTGTGPTTAPVIHLGGLATHGEGRLVLRTVHRHRVGRDDRVMVWLPPEYDQPAYRHVHFPVVMFLPGQPSTPQVVFRQFAFAQVASAAIAGGMAPFIGVFPTMMVDPPRDTECTNVPGGPQAERWLSSDVPAYVRHHFRAAPSGPDWTAMGWSTGGFCAAKLMLGHQRAFGSAVSFGGYYQPILDHTTGALFAGSRRLFKQNSPTWLLRSNGLLQDRLLVVASRQDRESWPQTRSFLRLMGTNPHVDDLTPPSGGHNYRVYRGLLPSSLRWAAQGWRSTVGPGLRVG